MDLILNTVQLLTLPILFVSVIILYMKSCLVYWEKREIPSLKSSIPFGNFSNPIIVKKSIGVQYRELYEKLREKGVNYGGVYSLLAPIFIPIAPEITKLILGTDFHHFHSRGFYTNEKDQPISAHLFAIEGERWRILRAKLTPTFTTGKMKFMFEMVFNCAYQMEQEVDNHVFEGKPINIKTCTSLYTTDVIGSCVFGVNCNSFKDPEAVIFKTLRHAITTTGRLVKSLFTFSFQNLSKKLKMVPFPKDSVDYFTKFMLDMVSYREKNRISRNDFLQTLIDMKNSELNNEADKLTIDEIISQSFLFFLAGFDTSSATMTFCLFELAQHPHIQQKARENINKILEKHNGHFTYDCISEMKYLRQVVDETLRKYPILPILHRKCNEEYRIPGTNDILEAGTQIIIPIMGIHHDPEYYPEPDKFDPERFTVENKNKLTSYTYLPFGEGPRHCIGRRFGIMMTITGLAVLLKKFNFTLNKKTMLPMELSETLLLQSVGDILLDVKVANE